MKKTISKESEKKQKGVAEGYAGVDDTDTVGFSVNSEAAYMAVMKQFGDVIDHNETSGIMYAPARIWPQIELVAFDADGEGATQDDGLDQQGVAEGNIEETIRKVKGGYRLYSKDGKKNLGTFDTRAGAEKHEREVQYFKHKG